MDFKVLMLEVVIDSNQANQRLDRFLKKRYKNTPTIPLSTIYQQIRKGRILVNAKRSSIATKLQIGDVVMLPDTSIFLVNEKKQISTKQLDLLRSWILYEDESRLVFNKPANMVLHPNNSTKFALSDYLDAYLYDSLEKKTSTFKASFGYRLDKDTSGVLIVGKTYQSLQYINQIIREKLIDKRYTTIVYGKPPSHELLDQPIQKNYNPLFKRGQMQLDKDGLPAQTEYRREKTLVHPKLGMISLLKVRLYTGRMHQIRIHLASRGFPILGDLVYGDPTNNTILYKHLHIKRQLLHCQRYEFEDRSGKRLVFEAPLPSEFSQLL